MGAWSGLCVSYDPQRLGAKGLKSIVREMAAGFALLYPPYTRISVSPPGCAEGQSPSALFSIPHEWGIKGG
jgi:hypothetical protein